MEAKLYEIPRGSKIYEECSDGSKYLIFNNIDGMYSHCSTEKGGVVHLSAATELEGNLESGWTIKRKKQENL